MKRLLTLFFLLLSTISYGTVRWQWSKFVTDTIRNNETTYWLVLSGTTDYNNNIYVAYISNDSYSQSAFVTKYSSSGERLWTVKACPPDSINRFSNRYYRRGKLYFDIDSNLVLVTGGYDTLGNHSTGYFHQFKHLTKWNQQGDQLNQLLDYFEIRYNHPSEIQDIALTPNGDIYAATSYDSAGHYVIDVSGYSKDFAPIFQAIKTFQYLNENEVCPPVIAVEDSLINIAYSTSETWVGKNIHIFQLNKNTGNTTWMTTQSNVPYNNYPIQLTIMDHKLCLNSFHLSQFSLQNGSLLNESQSTWNPTKCIYDSVNKITICALNADMKVLIYDSVSEIKKVVELPFYPYYISYKGKGLSVLGTYAGAQNYWTLITTDTLFNCIDTFNFLLPSYISSHTFSLNELLINDYSDNVILMNQVHLQYLNDTSGIQLGDAPIWLIKFCANCEQNIRGKVYLEQIANCDYDSSESLIENNVVHLMPDDLYTVTDSNGEYQFTKTSGIATIEYVPKFQNSFLCGGVSSYTIQADSLITDTLNFGVKFKGDPFNDIQSTLLCSTARRGFVQSNLLAIENLGSQVANNVVVILKIDSNFIFQSASVNQDSIVGNQVYWTIDSMNVGRIRNIVVDLLCNTTVPLNTIYKHSVSSTINMDIDPTNDSSTRYGLIIGSYDPNIKHVEPQGLGVQHYVDRATELNYMVEFQNTGTDTAFNIKIIDTLDANLDLSSLQLLGGSYKKLDYSLNKNVVQFNLTNILLPDSHTNYKASMGYVSYRIKPKANCHEGTLVKNRAAIYFDFNEAIITNTVYNTIGAAGSSFQDTTKSDFTIFPNPGENHKTTIAVHIPNHEKYSLEVLDVLGRVYFNIPATISTFGINYHHINFDGRLVPGIYFVVLNSGRDKVVKKWMVIEND